MKAGDIVRVRRLHKTAPGPWVVGNVLLASENLKSLALGFDEGISLHDAGLLRGKLILLLSRSEEHRCYITLMTNAPYEVERFAGRWEHAKEQWRDLP